MCCEPLLQKLSSIIDPSLPQWALVMAECFKGVITILKEISIVYKIQAENVKLNVEIVNLNEKIDWIL